MDFELSDEQRLLQDTVRRFVDDRILPNAVENDIKHHLDLGAIEGMAELGILGIVIPEEYGGAGLAFVLERGMPGFTTAAPEHKLGIWAGSTGELFFPNVEVPAENMLGDEGQGF